MKITTITVESKRSDGNWGNDVIRFEATPAPNENPLDVLRAMQTLVDAKFNGERRRIENETQLAILAASQDGGSEVTPKQVEIAERYIDKYGHWLEGVHAAEDMLEYER